MTDDVTALADWFWRRAGGAGPFPRDVAAAAAWALPLHVVELSGLTVAAVGGWLRRHGVDVPELPSRPLRACLVARAGAGVVLLDADNPDDERRYSAAHEVAHFLRDHAAARERARRALGPGAVDVLDGLRPASREERLAALFADVRLRPLTHLMDRAADGGCLAHATAEAEAAADRLALELLAPRREAERAFAGQPYRSAATTAAAAGRLAGDYGLPPSVAVGYARRLAARRDAARPLRDWLGIGAEPASAEKVENRRRTSGVRPERRRDGD